MNASIFIILSAPTYLIIMILQLKLTIHFLWEILNIVTIYRLIRGLQCKRALVKIIFFFEFENKIRTKIAKEETFPFSSSWVSARALGSYLINVISLNWAHDECASFISQMINLFF